MNRGAFSWYFRSGERYSPRRKYQVTNLFLHAASQFPFSTNQILINSHNFKHQIHKSNMQFKLFFTDFLETLKKGLASLTFPQQSPSKISSQQKNGTTSTLKEMKGNSRHEFIPKFRPNHLKTLKSERRKVN